MMTDPLSCDRVRYIRHPALPGVELMVAEPSHGHWRMFHERYLVCGCISVATSWRYRRKCWHIEDGRIGFMEPGEVHQVMTKHKPSFFHALFIESDAFIKLAEEAGISGIPHFRTAQAAEPELLQGITQLAAALRDGADSITLESQLSAVMQRTLAHADRRPVDRKWPELASARALNQARDYLKEHLHDPVPLDALARACGISRYHLVRSFTRQFGLPPHAYLIHARVKRAATLLRLGMPCVAVAPSLGFADQSHFTRHFKRIMGITPSQYARA